MVYDRTPLSRDAAEAVQQKWLGRPVQCTSIERLHGGMVNSVLLLEFDVEPGEAVIKISPEVDQNVFGDEFLCLQHLREHTDFPVPEPYLCESNGCTLPVSFFLLERLPGANLGEALMGAAGCRQIDHHMAQILARLHTRQREHFGSVHADDGPDNWLAIFQPMIRENWRECEGRIDPAIFGKIDSIIDNLQHIFDEGSPPTLVHGDIWATNVMVGRNSGNWHIIGFVDPSAQYADVEYELAYLRVFNTVSDEFFSEYTKFHELRDGFEMRCMIYWLNTMLRHVYRFGDVHYVHNAEQITRALITQLGL